MRSIAEGWRQLFLVPRKFEPVEREEAFLAHHCARFAALRRGSGALGILMWCGFLALDIILWRMEPTYAHSASWLIGLRVLGMPIFVLILLGALSRRFETDEAFATRMVIGVTLVLAMFISTRQLIAPFPFDYLYHFQGLMVALMFSFGMFRLRARQTVVVMLLITATQIAIMWLKPLEGMHVNVMSSGAVFPWLGSFLMVSVAVVGCGISVQLEVTERRSFEARQGLMMTNEAVIRRNREVERLNAALSDSKAESERHLRALVQAEEQLRADAEQRNRDKSRFLAHAVHDLKQPLQAIANALHPALQANRTGNLVKSAELVVLAQTAADAMRKQLSAILDISRLESGLIRVDLGDFELCRLIEEVVSQQLQVAGAHRVRLKYVFPAPGEIHVHSDRAFIERILLNLIGNGIKYRNPTLDDTAEVKVVTALDGERIRVEVIDNGLGIPEALLASGAIFEPFFQVNNRHPESEKGVGLGLSIVRAMVSMLPGHVLSVNSRHGEGSAFGITLPRSNGWVVRDVGVFPADCDAIDAMGLYVLLIEDDTLVRESTCALFHSHGVLHEAYDSYEAFASQVALLEREPDVLLSDFRLPAGRTAIDVVKHGRSLFPDIAVVVFSGEIGDFSGLRELPRVNFLRKPLAPEALLGAIVAGGRAPAADALAQMEGGAAG